MAILEVGLLGDKRDGYLPHEAAEKALKEFLDTNDILLNFEWLPTKSTKIEDVEKLDGLWAGSGPYLNEENALCAIQYARENNIPTIGTCSGFKYIVIEYAKHVFKAPDPFGYIGSNANCTTDFKDLKIELKPDCSLVNIYGCVRISEISHCTFQIADNVIDEMASQFEFCSVTEDGRTVLVRLHNHPFSLLHYFCPNSKRTVVFNGLGCKLPLR